MGLTDTERQTIRFYLGWPSLLYYANTDRLQQAMIAVDNYPDALTQIRDLFNSFDDIDTKLLDAHTRLLVLETGTTKLPGSLEINMLRDEGRRFVSRLSATLGIEIKADVYSGSPSRKDNEMMI